MKSSVTYATYVHDLVEGVSRNVHDLNEALDARGLETVDASPRVDVRALNRKRVYIRQGLAALRQLRAAMADPSVDVIHYHVSIPAMSLWGALARWRAPRRVPMVLHMWNPWFDPADAHVHAGLERAYHRIFNGPAASLPFLQAYDEIVVSSDYQRRQLLARGVARDIQVVSNGVDLVRYQPISSTTTRQLARRELGLPHDATLALYYGHLTPWKGVGVLAEALPQALSDPDAHLVIAHTEYGHRLRAVRDRVRELGVRDRVHFLGLCDVPLLLQAVDVGIVPATAAVGTACHPNVVLEYLGAGIPVVASRVGSIPEAIDHGETGLLVEPGRPGLLGEALDRLLSDPARRSRMSSAARRSAEARFDWDEKARHYEAIYRRVV